MATQDEHLHKRATSPSPHLQPTLALHPSNDQRRYFSTGSTASSTSSYRSSSLGPPSATDSNGSSSRASSVSYTTRRPVSGSYTFRQTTGGLERPKNQRRGYVRPQGTNFALSAQSRESVMNLGSIAHLQYYFARTGLLDGKGGQLAKKKENGLGVDTTCSITSVAGGRGDYRPVPSRNSPDLDAQTPISPGIAGQEEFFNTDDEEEADAIEMLPPTVSTYNVRTKPTPRLPTYQEYKDNLRKCLQDAARSLAEAKAAAPLSPDSPAARHMRSPSKANAKAIAGAARVRSESNATLFVAGSSRMRSESNATLLTGEGEGPEHQNEGWYEVQGVHILDVVTLAIRAARQYYSAHPHPSRLRSIKPERRTRAELLSVMEVLRRMATRNFSKGMRREEVDRMEKWVSGAWDLLAEEEAIEKREMDQRSQWTWLEDANWPAPVSASEPPNPHRELAFLRAMDGDAQSPLPDDLGSDFEAVPVRPSPFLRELQSGLRLVHLHNAMVAKSLRPFGAIPAFHSDVGKPYRMAENLRFWIKAAELRWEIVLKVDVMGVVNGADAQAWSGFETAVWRWAEGVRGEVGAEIRGVERPRTARPIGEVVRREREEERELERGGRRRGNAVVVEVEEPEAV